MTALSSGGIANGKSWCGWDLEQIKHFKHWRGWLVLPDPSLRAPADAQRAGRLLSKQMSRARGKPRSDRIDGGVSGAS